MSTFPLTLLLSGPSGASDTIFKCHHGVQTKLQVTSYKAGNSQGEVEEVKKSIAICHFHL